MIQASIAYIYCHCVKVLLKQAEKTGPLPTYRTYLSLTRITIRLTRIVYTLNRVY